MNGLQQYLPPLGSGLAAQSALGSSLAAHSALGSAIQNALMQSDAAFNYWVVIKEKQKRMAFYHSCSQNWLNAMLDVELGL